MVAIPKKPTHRLQETPSLTVRKLADYMAASLQVRRRILRDSKCQPIARVIQHNEAKAVITDWITAGAGDTAPLSEKVSQMRDRFYDDDFESETNQHNCDFIDAFIEVAADIDFPDAEFVTPGKMPPLNLNGTTVRFSPQMLLRVRFKIVTSAVMLLPAVLR